MGRVGTESGQTAALGGIDRKVWQNKRTIKRAENWLRPTSAGWGVDKTFSQWSVHSRRRGWKRFRRPWGPTVEGHFRLTPSAFSAVAAAALHATTAACGSAARALCVRMPSLLRFAAASRLQPGAAVGCSQTAAAGGHTAGRLVLGN